MVNKHEDWIEALREAATPDGGELPAGLWNRISASLDAAPPDTGVFPPHPLRRRRFHVRAASVAAVAAAVLLTAGIFMMLTEDTGDAAVSQSGIPVETGIPAGNAVAVTPEPAREGQGGGYITAVTEPDVSGFATAIGSGDIPESAAEPEPAAAVGATEVVETETVPAVTAEPEKDAGKDAGKDGVSPAEIRTDTRSLPRRGHSRMAAVTKPSQRGMLAMSVSGMPSSSDASPANPAMRMKTAALTPNREGYMVMEVRPPQYSYRHRQPLTFAVSIDFGVGHNLFAGTGVSYTRLSSIATDMASGDEFDQLLQYVGVPATFKWTFLNTKHFMLYTGVEAQAEFCVGARFDGRKADERTMQWSVHGLAGAQLNLGRHAGIYVEPKLSHYFMATELETVRNARSVNFNLQLGLRFSY